MSQLDPPASVSPDSPHDIYMGPGMGIVKFFKNDYGIIVDKDSNLDIFAHYRAIDNQGYKALAKGQRVAYYTYRGSKGLYAKKITVVPG